MLRAGGDRQPDALVPRLRELGLSDRDIGRVFATFNVAAPGFVAAHEPLYTIGRRRDDA
jgi:hypothetical protein